MNSDSAVTTEKGKMRILSKKEVAEIYRLRDEGKSYGYIRGLLDISSNSVIAYWLNKRESEKERLHRLFVYPERIASGGKDSLMCVGWNAYRDTIVKTIEQLVSEKGCKK